MPAAKGDNAVAATTVKEDADPSEADLSSFDRPEAGYEAEMSEVTPILCGEKATFIRRTPAELTLETRRPEFSLEGVPRYWLNGDPVRTHFANALSILIPPIEYLVLHILRKYKAKMPSPLIQKDVEALIRQEGTHAAVHTVCNQKLYEVGYMAVPRVNRWLRKVLLFLARWLPARVELAAPAMFEVFTSSLSHQVVADRKGWLGERGAPENGAAQVLLWHSLEELEHQSVCGDAYHQLYPGQCVSKLLLAVSLLPILLSLAATHLYLLAKDGLLKRAYTWKQLASFFFSSRHPYRTIVRDVVRELIGKSDAWGGIDVSALKEELAELPIRQG